MQNKEIPWLKGPFKVAFEGDKSERDMSQIGNDTVRSNHFSEESTVNFRSSVKIADVDNVINYKCLNCVPTFLLQAHKVEAVVLFPHFIFCHP